MNRQWDGYSGVTGGGMPVAYSPPPIMQIPPSAVPVAGPVSMFPPMAVPGSPAVYGAPMYGAPVSVDRVTTLSVPADSTDEDIQKRILAMLPPGSTYVGKAEKGNKEVDKKEDGAETEADGKAEVEGAGDEEKVEGDNPPAPSAVDDGPLPPPPSAPAPTPPPPSL